MQANDELLDYYAVINKISDGITVSDATGHFEVFNARMQELSGYSMKEANSVEDFNTLIHPGSTGRQEMLKNLGELANEKECREIETVIRSKDGTEKKVLVSTSLVRYKNWDMFLSVWRDVTDHRKAEAALAASESQYRRLFESAKDGILILDAETGMIVDVNPFLVELLGFSRETFLGTKVWDLGFFKDAIASHEKFMELQQKGYVRYENLPLETLDGRKIEVEFISNVYWVNHHKVIQCNIRDITNRKLLENKLLNMAQSDTLTKLLNRTAFLEKANLEITRARRTGKQCAVLFVDLDHFKSVNDTLGHSLGDELLKDTAAKLATCIRETDVMARVGGDEFIIFSTDMDSGLGAQYIAERIREKFNAPRLIAGNDLFITASVGIAVFPHDGDSLEDLLKNADTAMYVAKQAGRNMYRFFDAQMNKNAVSKMQVQRGLRDALEKKEFTLFYQPIVNVADGKVRGFEALLRWFTPGGLVPPDEFIPVAEESGLIVPIGAWVLQEACRFNKQLVDSGYGDTVVSVNISVVQLRRKDLVDVIKSALDESGLRPELLEIEVTESLFIETFAVAIEVLDAIRALGVQISLDDFGTGYSSLVHLQKLPIMNLKIDRLFIKEIAKDSEENAMIPAIIDLAHKLKIGVIAEGVETKLQLEKLSGNRCDYYQGYLFSKPVSSDDVTSFLVRSRKRGKRVKG